MPRDRNCPERIYEAPRTKPGNYWPTVYSIKDNLRNALGRPGEANVIHSDRASGKTTGLVQFVAERTLILPYEKKILVIAPNLDIARRFEGQFRDDFPKLRVPDFVTFQRETGSCIAARFSGREYEEVYIEEVFLIRCETVEAIRLYFKYKYIAGVGTLESVASFKITRW